MSAVAFSSGLCAKITKLSDPQWPSYLVNQDKIAACILLFFILITYELIRITYLHDAIK